MEILEEKLAEILVVLGEKLAEILGLLVVERQKIWRLLRKYLKRKI